MKSIYSFTVAMMILAGAALFLPHVMKAGPGSVTAPNSTASPAAIVGQKMNWAANYGKLPLSFEANQGQTDPRVKFVSRGRGYSLFLTGDEAVLEMQVSGVRGQVSGKQRPLSVVRGHSQVGRDDLLRAKGTGLGTNDQGKMTKDSILRMKLLGANASAAVMGADELPGKSNYFVGNDPKKWRTNVPTFAQVKYQNVYPGVDLVYYGNQGGQLEYDFVVAPGADPTAIRLSLSGRREEGGSQSAAGRGKQDFAQQQSKFQNLKSKIDSNGDLVVKTDGGEVRMHKPVIYQTKSTTNRQSAIDNRQFLEGHYTLDAQNQVRFQVAPYDHSKALFIDPVILNYSTFLGGSRDDYGQGIAVDSSGNAYVTGMTRSPDFPTTGGAYQTSKSDLYFDVFVTKLSPDGASMVYSTYLGGSNWDAGAAIAIDSSGNAYVTGHTESTDFPTANPFQASCAGYVEDQFCFDAFVTKLNPTGSGLVYSTYLGGSGEDSGAGIALDSFGNAYVAGFTTSRDFPTLNPFQATNSGGEDAFVAKVNSTGSALVYSTYLGGSYNNFGNAIAVDSSGNAYVTGSTNSTDFPTASPFQATLAGSYNAFVTKFNAAGSDLVYSTYLGGSGQVFDDQTWGDSGYGIAVDSSGDAYVTGSTASSNFPTVNPFQATCGGCSRRWSSAFVTKFNPAGTALVYSTYLGGTGALGYGSGQGDEGLAIAVDSSGNSYVTGEAFSINFPTTPGAPQTTNYGAYNVFVSQLNFTGLNLSLVYSTYLGGHDEDMGSAIALDSSRNAYVTGFAGSPDFPTTVGAYQTVLRGGPNAFVTKLACAPAVSLSPASLSFAPQDVGNTSPPQSVTLTNTGCATLTPLSIAASGDYAETNTCGSSVAAGGNCSISVTFTPTAILTRTGDITLTDNALPSPQIVPLTGTGILPVVCLPSSLIFPSTIEFTSSPTQTVNCTNTQNINVTFTSISTNLADFGVTNSGTCSLFSPLAPHAYCSIVISFTPSVLGLEGGVLTITDSANPQSVSLSGRGIP